MWYFSVSCQISASPLIGIFSFFLCSAGIKILFNLKCWQLNPKIYLKDFIDFWFNCVRLLNHVKVTMTKPFTHGMKSVGSNLIGPMPPLCQCPPFAVWLLQGSNSAWNGERGSPVLWCDACINKWKATRNKTEPKIDSQSCIDNIWTCRVILYCP